MRKVAVFILTLFAVAAAYPQLSDLNKPQGQSVGDVVTWNGSRGVWKKPSLPTGGPGSFSSLLVSGLDAPSVLFSGSGGTVSQDSGVFIYTAASDELRVGSMWVNRSGQAKLRFEGTNMTETSGNLELGESNGEFWFTGRDSERHNIDNDTTSANATFSVIAQGVTGSPLMALAETTGVKFRVSARGWRAGGQRALQLLWPTNNRELFGIMADTNRQGSFTSYLWRNSAFANFAVEGSTELDEDLMVAKKQTFTPDTSSLKYAVAWGADRIVVNNVPSGWGIDREITIGSLAAGDSTETVHVLRVSSDTMFLNTEILRQTGWSAGVKISYGRWRGQVYPGRGFKDPSGTMYLGANLSANEAKNNHVQRIDYGRHVGIIQTDVWGDMIINGGQVLQSTPANMAVNAGGGSGVVRLTNEYGFSVSQGFFAEDQNSLAIATADPSNPRIDLVYWDSIGVARVITGTPAASPSAPTKPTGTLRLAHVTVGAGVTSITNSDISDQRAIGIYFNRNVGFGITSPAYPIHVSGNARFTGNIYFTNPIEFVDGASSTYGWKSDVTNGLRFYAGSATRRAQITTAGVFGVGASNEFTVGSDGDLDKIKNVAYSWPTNDGDPGERLTTDGSGNLTWDSAGTGSGEATTASNLGGGLAVFSAEVGDDLQFNTLNASDFDLASNVVSIDGANWASQTEVDAKVASTRELTISGTTNEVTASGGTQTLAADRSWTIGLPDDVTITDDLTVTDTLLVGTRAGIGTSSPGFALHVAGATAVLFGTVNTATSGSGAGALGTFYSDDGAAMASDDRLGGIGMGGVYDGSHTLNTQASVEGFAAEAWSSGARGTYIVLKTTATGASSRSERVRIDAAGNVGIGDASPASLLTVGSGDVFQVGSDGDLDKIKNIAYTWPTDDGDAGEQLQTNGSGVLTWEPAGSTTWGAITGTLSSQTDLQSALDAKADVAGETFTGNVAFGNGDGQYYATRYGPASAAFNWDKSNSQSYPLVNGSNVLTLSTNVKDGGEYYFALKQPTTGAHGFISWPANLVWHNGVTGVLHKTNSTVDVYRFWYNGLDSKYYIESVYDSNTAGSISWGSILGTLSDQTDLQAALDAKAPLASPTFTGTVTIPTPFTLGATSVTPTGTELNYVDGVTSAIQTQIDGKVGTSRTVTIAGTANEVESSAGAQDLSANRTWTLGLPDDVTITSDLTVNDSLYVSDHILINATSVPFSASGRNYLAIGGGANDGRIQLFTRQADASGVGVGAIEGVDINSVAADPRVARALVLLSGSTATNRGGSWRFDVKADGSSGTSAALLLDQDRSATFGSTGLKFNSANGGAINTVAGVTTDGKFGVPVVNDTLMRSAQTAAISATNFASAAGGAGIVYKVRAYAECTTVSGSGSPTLDVTISWTDDVGATTSNIIAALPLSSTGRAFGTGFYLVASGNLQWSTTINAASGSPQYKIFLACERVN